MSKPHLDKVMESLEGFTERQQKRAFIRFKRRLPIDPQQAADEAYYRKLDVERRLRELDPLYLNAPTRGRLGGEARPADPKEKKLRLRPEDIWMNRGSRI